MTKKARPDDELANTYSSGTLEGNREPPELLIDNYKAIFPIITLNYAINFILDTLDTNEDKRFVGISNLNSKFKPIHNFILHNKAITSTFVKNGVVESHIHENINQSELEKLPIILKEFSNYIDSNWNKINSSLIYSIMMNPKDGNTIKSIFTDDNNIGVKDGIIDIIDKLAVDIENHKEGYKRKFGITNDVAPQLK